MLLLNSDHIYNKIVLLTSDPLSINLALAIGRDDDGSIK